MAKDSYRQQSVQSIDRTVTILRALAGSHREFGVSELAKHVDLGKGTVHRLLTTLAAHRLVEQCETSGKYRLGWGLFELGNRVPGYVTLQEACHTSMEELCRQSRETVNLAIPVGRYGVIIDRVEPREVLRAYLEIGTREPLHATALGKAILLDSTQQELQELLGSGPWAQLTPHTCSTLPELLSRIQDARERGFTIDDEELSLGLRCIGAPIRNHAGKIIAAVSLSGPAHRLTYERIDELKDALLASASRMSLALGYTGIESVSRPQQLGMGSHTDK